MREILGVVVTCALVACAAHRAIAVASAADARRAAGRLVRVTGVAADAKLGAAIQRGDLVVFLLDRESWPTAEVGREVTVEGVLEETRDFIARTDDAGAISQGTSGAVFVIRRSSLP